MSPHAEDEENFISLSIKQFQRVQCFITRDFCLVVLFWQLKFVRNILMKAAFFHNEPKIKVILSKWVNIIVCWVQFHSRCSPVQHSAWDLNSFIHCKFLRTKYFLFGWYLINNYNIRSNKSHSRRQRRETIRWFLKSILQTKCSLLHNVLWALGSNREFLNITPLAVLILNPVTGRDFCIL